MAQSSDVIVVGGGPVGAACARELAEAGRKVLLIDRGDAQGEGWRAAAGMLAAQAGTQPEDPLFELGLAGRERYAEWATPLRESTGIDIGFWQEGIARIAADEDDAALLRSSVAGQRQQGHLCDWFDAGEVKDRWPWIGATHGALWAPRDAALHPERLVEALGKDAERLGATVLRDQITGVERRGNRVVGVSGRETYHAGDVILAAGAWSRLLAGLPRPLAVEPIRGQMAALAWPSEVPRAIVLGRGAYVASRDGEAVVGSTMEHAGFNAEVTAAGLAEIFTGVSAICPALAGGEVLRTWAGLRPVTPDGLPIIGREPRLEGLWYATGHGRNGILLAGITGVIIARLLVGENEVEDLAALRPERFWEW
ncbi:MAG TPA: glycine oxidase ThiO [Gemmatimonadales bacterium]|nr:glycine oxidase ThiO [Gemmatimonadales bacterium]